VTDQRYRTTRRVTLVGAAVNCLLAGLQISFGLIGKSQALVADGIHTLSDLATDFIVLYAAGRAAREADAEHPYGHGRIETLASMLLGVLLALVGAGIGMRGVESILDPARSNPEAITIAFAALAIVAKEGLYRYTLAAARKVHSRMLEANAWHHRSDAWSSIVVLIGITAQVLGVPHMDAGAAIIVAGMIILMGYRLSRGALQELIDTSLDNQLVEDIRNSMLEHSSVTGIHNLRSRSMGGLGYIDAHVEVDSDLTVSEAHFIAHKMEQLVKRKFPEISDAQFHIDPLDDAVKESVLAALPARKQIEADLAQAWDGNALGERVSQIKLHYLDRLVEIDLVLPLELSGSGHAEAVAALRQAAAGLDYVGRVNLYYSA